MKTSTHFDSDETGKTIDLVLRVQAGDDSIKEELFRRWHERIHRVVRVRMGAALRAKESSLDLVQEAAVQLLEGLERYEHRGSGAYVNWIATIVEHVIRGRIDYWSAVKRHPGFELELERLKNAIQTGEFDPLPPAANLDPGEVLAGRELQGRMLETLALLPEDQREVITLRRIAGCTLAETAEIMGRSKDAVGMLCSRAEARLYSLLASSKD